MLATAGVVADDESDLLARAAAFSEFRDWTDLTRPVLAQLASEKGGDFATALLYERLRSSERHGPFIRQIDELLSGPAPDRLTMDVLIAVVPGAFYRELPRTGADGWLLRQRVSAFGCRTAVVPTRSTGTVAENGRLLCDWLAGHADDTVVLASLSKGAADIKAALAQPGADSAFRPVRAWLNLSGMPNGSPVANWVLDRKFVTLWCKALAWWKGIDFAVTRQLRWGPGTVLDFPLMLPDHLRLINVVGFPLQRHLSSDAMRRCQGRLAPLGPNDGFVLLVDACTLPGMLYPVWGADHNLRPAWDIRRLVAALAVYLAEQLHLRSIRVGS